MPVLTAPRPSTRSARFPWDSDTYYPVPPHIAALTKEVGQGGAALLAKLDALSLELVLVDGLDRDNADTLAEAARALSWSIRQAVSVIDSIT